jgi:signal transduction histidine kinase
VRLPWSVFVWLTALASFYVSLALIVSADGREHRNRMLLAQRLLFYESDPVAEMLLKDIERKLLHDPYIRDILNSENFSQTDIYEILSDRYFKGYFQRYDLRPMVCTPDKQLHITEEDKEINCFDFFADERENQGMPLPGSSHFRLMNSYWGRIFYFGYFKIPGEKNVTLFIELYSKPEVEAIGYPELLKIESKDIDFQFKDYSYAKYSNDKRVTKSGDFDYTFELPDKHRQNGFYSSDGYSHYMYSDDENNAVIISAVEMDFFDCVSMFSYSFAIVIIVLFVIFSLTGLKPEIIKSKHSYRWKISLVILVCLISALTSVTGAMLAYAINQSDRKNIDAIHGKMQSIIIELDQDLFYRESITPEMLSMLENTLIKLSNAFYTDLNLYDSSGDLIISSRNEIFEKNLLGKKMNHDAFEALSSDKQAKYIHTEHIGTLNYFSSYATYYNSEGKALAYINLPHFYRPSELRNELLTLIGSVLSIYIFLIITGIALSVFVSDQITRPLDLVRREMSKVNLAEQPEPIDYNADNELGALVGEYNRMIAELAQSARILAENERESAWREMARQIAHEIKNPLTPMKLNIQLAMRMKERRDEGWQDKMNEAMKSILEQIDILSSTASEFSDFARTGKAQCEPVDLAQSIKSGLALFAGYSINFTRNPTENYFVKANREQLQRVLTNFIKNSIQATENVVAPEIDIALLTDDNSYVVSISDNGVGISEEAEKNLFRPNFTTKSGSTGLGLAISKGIIESFGGTVVFVRREQGACFEIRLPVMEWKL